MRNSCLAVAFERVLEAVDTIGDGFDHGFGHAPRIILQCFGMFGHHLDTVFDHQVAQAMGRPRDGPPSALQDRPDRSSGSRLLAVMSASAPSLIQPAEHELDRRDDESLLVELGAEGQRPRRHAADIGVVGAAGDEVGNVGPGEHRRDHRDVGQVGAAAVGVVEHDDIALLKRLEGVDGRLDRGGHTAQMHRDVGRLRHHARLRIEHGAAKVEPFLDVGAETGAFERLAHVLGDRGEQVLEDFEGNCVYGHGLIAS